ncbi:hypothetical protein, partial [Microbacterium sp. CPCC 204701]|uniref:hypothetical protein n=1 Tax=Microbacterium sp. CPCC 204701 TaxID=2493084 RepID=UPI00406C2018
GGAPAERPVGVSDDGLRREYRRDGDAHHDGGAHRDEVASDEVVNPPTRTDRTDQRDHPERA